MQISGIVLAVLLGSKSLLAASTPTTIVEPLLEGHWLQNDYSCSYSDNCNQISFSGDQIFRRTQLGKEILEEKSRPFRVNALSQIEVLDDQTGAVLETLDYAVILSKMKICKSPRNCVEYKRISAPFEVTEVKLKRIISFPSVTLIYDDQYGNESKDKHLLAPWKVYTREVKKGKFGKKTHYSWNFPGKKYRLEVELTSYYTNGNGTKGRNRFDYSFLADFKVLDSKSKQVLTSSREIGSQVGVYWRNPATDEGLYVSIDP
ncbi:MAG: hypothetical protein JNL01_03325 [Bdellovibrionales bacterium]|nr:hypothetical protein [Bdellovibrionales bacterium]